MTNVHEIAHEIARINNKTDKLIQKYGGADNVVLNGTAYLFRSAGRTNGWDCEAIQTDGNTIRFGLVHWDVKLEDASDYDWGFTECDFLSHEEFDLEDPEELAEVLERLGL